MVESLYLRLKGPSQPPPFSMTSKLLIKHGEANSYCFTVMHLSLETPTPPPHPGETWGIRGDLQVLR